MIYYCINLKQLLREIELSEAESNFSQILTRNVNSQVYLFVITVFSETLFIPISCVLCLDCILIRF